MSNVICIKTRRRINVGQETKSTGHSIEDKNKERRSNLEYTGYWGHVVKRTFAWFPTKTEDEGWIWLKRYYRFDTNTGYDKHSYAWECQGKTVAPLRMMAIKMGFYACESGLDLSDWRRKRGLTS